MKGLYTVLNQRAGTNSYIFKGKMYSEYIEMLLILDKKIIMYRQVCINMCISWQRIYFSSKYLGVYCQLDLCI